MKMRSTRFILSILDKFKEKIMTDFTVLDIVKYLVLCGCNVEIKAVGGTVVFDLDTRTEYPMYIATELVDGGVNYSPYGDVDMWASINITECASLEECVKEFTKEIRYQCMASIKPEVSSFWLKLMLQHGYAVEEQRVITNVRFV
jgi:hypothetical protein